MWSPQQPATPTAHPRKGKPGKPGKPKKRRPLWLTILKWTFIVGFACTALLVATVAFVFWMYGRDPSLPDYKTLSDYKPKQVIAVLDANDRRIGEVFGPDKKIERRTFVAYDKLPAHVVDSFVAAEDNRFWQHAGVDYWGMFRAFLTNVRSGKRHGASTITQQVVKTFLLTPEKTFKRKIQEIIIARRLEKSLTKQEIMTLYLNQIYFGNNRYGIQEAARFYFGKDVANISVGEAALLAALPQRPEELAPNRKKNQAAAKARQIYVLNQLVAMKKLQPADAQKWMDAPIAVVEDPFPLMDTAPEWIARVRGELIDDLKKRGKKEDELDRMGGTVRTTLDPGMQANAQRALQNGLRAVDKRHKVGRPQRNVKPDAVDAEIAKLAKSFPGKLKAKETYAAVVTAVHDTDNELVVDLGNYKAAIVLGDDIDARFNPDQKKPNERFKIGDVVEVAVAAGEAKIKHAEKRVAFAPGPEGAVVVIEVKSRKVRALVGGYQSKRYGLNRATDAKRQPGSSFKPFVFGAGIEAGKFTAGTRVPDTLQHFEQVGKAWKPKNYDGKTDGFVLLRNALARSINTVSIKVAVDTTPQAIVAYAHKLGIESDLPAETSIALGSGEVTPLEMTNAITTYAAGGIHAKPQFVEAINGKATAAPAGERVVDEKVAYVVTDMMRSVVTSGTGHLANALKIPIAGKTGTSNEAKDVWFVAFTPEYVVGVWIGYDEPQPMGKETGGTTAVPVFVELMKTMNQPAKAFARPAGIVEAKINKSSQEYMGKLAPEGAEKGSMMTEIYIKGTEPTEYAPLDSEVTESNLSDSEYQD
ncbi:MAG: PBP1A family penicillin-binding protein [Myxococcota bacterium]|nr:PBP1A family penicillin-binding protein [Myxococcota bacterium]